MYQLTFANEQSNRSQIRLKIAAVHPGECFGFGDRLLYVGKSAIRIAEYSKAELRRPAGDRVNRGVRRAVSQRKNEHSRSTGIRFLPIGHFPSSQCDGWN